LAIVGLEDFLEENSLSVCGGGFGRGNPKKIPEAFSLRKSHSCMVTSAVNIFVVSQDAEFLSAVTSLCDKEYP
jgi:hypothetical protein